MWTEEMNDLSIMPVSQAPPLRDKSSANHAVVAVSIPPPAQGSTSKSGIAPSAGTWSSAAPTNASSVWAVAIAASVTPDGIELDQIPYTNDGAVLSDDLPQAEPPPEPKAARQTAKEMEPPMEMPRMFGLDPHPKTEQTRTKEAAKVYEEERVISNAPRPEPIKPTWEQVAPVKPRFDTLKDVEIAEILD